MARKPTKEKPETGVKRGRYYEAYKEGKGRDAEIVVNVWATDKKVGEPAHEWGMPTILPIDAAVDQAILQSL